MNKQKVVIGVDGMTCSHCTNFVDRTLQTVDGVLTTNVSLADGTATVEYDANTVSKDDLVAAIGETHYTVREVSEV